MYGGSAAAGRRLGNWTHNVALATLLGILVVGCGTTPEPSSPATSESSSPNETARPLPSPALSPPPSSSPTPSWTAVIWTASDPAPFSGPGNQYVLDGVPWADGSVLVGEEAPLPSGNAEGVVWTSADNARWQRIPNTNGTFSGAAIEGVAATGSTLVAVGDSQLEDNATTLAPPIGIAWVSTDGTDWQRSPDPTGVLGDMVLHGVAAGPFGFVAYGSGLAGGTAIAFSSDGLRWQREAADVTTAASNVAAITWTGDGFAAVGGHDVTQPTGIIGQAPGPAAAWWSSDGQLWHQSDIQSTGYELESVQLWLKSLRATGIPPCFGCISAPAEWRSTDGGRTWRSLPTPGTPLAPASTALLVGGRAVSLQEQPEQISWTADGQTWNLLDPKGPPLANDARLIVAGDQEVIAIASVTAGLPNDQEDMRVFEGQLH
jgi:hypothetical protein